MLNQNANISVSENSNLAKMGSLSYRLNIGPIVTKETEDEIKEHMEEERYEKKYESTTDVIKRKGNKEVE